MSLGGSVRAAVSIAAAFLVVGFCVSAGPGCAADDDDARFIVFSGRDLWRNGIFAHGGLLMAPGGFDQDGLLLKVLLSGGLYRYNAGDLGGETVIGAEWLAQVLPGWRIKRGSAEFKFFVGPDIQRHRLWPDDPGNQLRGSSFGLRMAAELWYELTATTLIAGDASLSSIATSNSARMAYGWRVFEKIYAGPETQVIASDGYRQLRFGVHFTTMKAERHEWSAGTGFARDSDHRSGLYLRVGVMTRL